MNTANLLPCPFCGEQPRRGTIPADLDLDLDHCVVICKNLVCPSAPVCSGITHEAAQEAWNTRSPVKGEVDFKSVAAPELLAALELAYSHINGGAGIQMGMAFGAMHAQIKAAIAKATGVLS